MSTDKPGEPRKTVSIVADPSLLTAAIEHSLNGFDIVGEQGEFIYVNQSYAEMWGYSSPEEVLQTRPADHCADPEIPLKIIKALKETGKCDIEFLARRKDGSTFDVRMLAFLAHDSNGREIYPTTSIDITQQKRATREIEVSESRFRELVDNSPAVIWMTDAESRCTYLSKGWYDYTGRTPAQDLGFGWLENIHPDDRDKTARLYTNAVRECGVLSIDYRLRGRNGEYRWFVDKGFPRLDKNGVFTGYIGTVTDIHDRVIAVNKLNDVSDRFFRSAKASDLGVWYCDLPFDVLQWDAQVKNHFFLPPDATVTIETFYERIHPDDRERTRSAIATAIAEKTPYDIHYRTCNPNDILDFKWIRAIGWTDYDGLGEPIRFDGITLDATEEFRRNEELVRARDEAERANKLKSAFLANMSHEIRTPLGAMLGFSDLLRDPSLSEAERQNYLNILTRNGEQLSLIINDILDLSKVEAGHLQLEFVETAPASVASEVVSLMQVKAREKDLAIDLEFAPTLPEVIVADPTRMRQVLLNLVGNATKFTHIGKIILRASGEKDQVTGEMIVRFEIEDTGIGIPADQRQNVFAMFVQADGSMTRRFGGTGLGLSLSRRLAREMGGDVVLAASEEGKGSTFVFTVKSLPDRRVEKSSGKLIEESDREPANDALEGLRVLVVDDSPDNQRLIWLHLKKYGAIVDSAENGFDGYKKALKGDFDIVLMDLQMPSMDGYTATQHLRENGFRKPIIALTAHAMSEVRLKCLQVGCTDHLPKPINARQLVNTIAKHVARLRNN